MSLIFSIDKGYNEDALKKDMGLERAVCKEESFLTVDGALKFDLDKVEIKCSFKKTHNTILVPRYIFNPNEYSPYYIHGKVREEFYDKEFDGFYISPSGNIHCRRECFNLHTDD